MVTFTRFNGTKITINAFLIETVEETPDTLITLTTGKKIMVLEKVSDVISLVQSYMRQIGAVRIALKTNEMEES
jgi:flagellar protein FlbD